MIFCSALDKLIANQIKSLWNVLYIFPISLNVSMPETTQRCSLQWQNKMKWNNSGNVNLNSCKLQRWWMMCRRFHNIFFFSEFAGRCCCCWRCYYCLVWMPIRFHFVSICAQFALKFIDDSMEMKLNNKLSNITIGLSAQIALGNKKQICIFRK